jgi:hypothetical protein
MPIDQNTTSTTVKDDKTKDEMPIPKGSQVNTSLGSRFNTSNYRNQIIQNQGGGGGSQNNLDLDKEMLNQVDYSMGGSQGNEFMDEDGNIIGYGPSYGDSDPIDISPGNFFAKYDDSEATALAQTNKQLAAEEIYWAKEGATSASPGEYLNPDGTGINLGSTDAEKAADKAAADKAAAELAALESGIAANLIPAPDFYRGDKNEKSITDGGFIADFYRINKAGEYVDHTGKLRAEGWVPEAGAAPKAPKGEQFYFGAYGELQSGSTKNNTDLPWFSPPTPGYTKSPQQGIKPKHTKEDGSMYYRDPQGSGMYIQNIDNKQNKNQIQTQLNKQKAERAYNQMTKEWTFDYLRATGDKKKTKQQAYAFLDSKVRIMDSWGMGQGGVGFGGTRESNKKDLQKRIKQAYGQRDTETKKHYGMLNRQQPQNNKQGPGIMFGNSTTWDKHLSDPNYSY